MTARKVAVAILFAAVALYLGVTWAIDWFQRESKEDPPDERVPVPLKDAQLVATHVRPHCVPVDCPPWTVAVASSDVAPGTRVGVGELGPQAAALTIRERGAVVACDVRVVESRDDLAPRTVAVYAGTGESFTLEQIELLLYPAEE